MDNGNVLQEIEQKNFNFELDVTDNMILEGKIESDIIGSYKQYPLQLAWATSLSIINNYIFIINSKLPLNFKGSTYLMPQNVYLVV